VNSSFSSNTSAADQQEARSIYQSILSFDLTRLSTILNGLDLRKSLEIVNLQDEAGYTVLHSAAYYNTFKIADFLISFFRRRLT
jgi:ankyrin repeat protein